MRNGHSTRRRLGVARLPLILGLVTAALAAPRASAAQYTDMGRASFSDERLDSGLGISGTLHARAGTRGGVFVQMGLSDLRWDSYYHNGLEYTYDELVGFFGDRVPDRRITDGSLTPEFQLSNAIVCGLYYHVRYRLDMKLAGVDDMDDGVFNGIMSEYTYSIDDMERQDDDAARRDARCIGEHEGMSLSVNILDLDEHYFPVQGTMTTIETRLAELLDEREAARKAAEESDGRASANDTGASLSVTRSSKSDKGKRAEEEDVDEEDDEADRPERELSASEAAQELQLQAMAQAAELEREGDRLAAAGNYLAAKRAYQEAYGWVARPELADKIQQMDLRSASDAAADVVVGSMMEEVDRPNEIIDQVGYLQVGGGALSVETDDVGFLDFTLGYLFNWKVGSDWAISAEIDGGWTSLMGSGCDPYGISRDDCPNNTVDDGTWTNVQGFLGGTWKGYIGAGYGLMGTRLNHSRQFDAGLQEFEGEFVIQEAGHAWIGTRQKRGGFSSRLSMYATGELLGGERTIDEPYYSTVVYRAEAGMNMFYLRYNMFEDVYFSGEGPETDSYGWSLTVGLRFVKY